MSMSLIIVLTFLIVGPEIESRLFPVKSNFRITEVKVNKGTDLVVQGTMRKERSCLFVPGIVVKDSHGRLLPVTNKSKTQTVSWVTTKDGESDQSFGPWVVHNGAGGKLRFYQHFRCHFLWTTTSYLGDYYHLETE